MNTVCHKQLRFESLFGKQVTADFDGGNISSDAGGLQLRELDERYGLIEGAANCLADPRHSSWVIHQAPRDICGFGLAAHALSV
jgi:hypothetical protein